MKLIDRYLLRTLLVPLVYCLAAFIMIYVVYDLFDHLPDFIEARTAFQDVVRYYIYLIPSVLILIVPISLLLAVLYSLSQLTKNNELTAMRASGVSLYRLLVPFTLVGLLFSLGVLQVNERIGPESALWCNQFLQAEKNKGDVSVHIKEFQPLVNELEHRYWMVQRFHTITFDMEGVELRQERTDGSFQVKYTAERAQWLDGEWWFHEVAVQQYDEGSNPIGGPQHVPHLVLDFVTETPKDFLNEIKYNQEFMSAREIADFVRTRPHIGAATEARYRTDFHYRLAMPWTCFVVTLLGIPLGSTTGRRGAFVGVFLSISMFFTYYVFITYGLALGKNGTLSPWVAGWFPNILFAALGLTFLYRMR
jgi:lipopolysaccharide export system permease protein